MSDILPCSVAILAGGKSTRLGHDKATMPLAGVPLLSHVAGRVAPFTDDLMVVLRVDQTLPLTGPWRLVRDVEQGIGIVAGLASALQNARHEWVWGVGVDMPFASPDLVRYALSISEGWDAVVPRTALGLEALHAIYHRRCLPTFMHAVETDQRRVLFTIRALRTRYLDEAELATFGPADRLFFNINTPEDLARAEQIISAA
jgi:molybdopterin-guanine dinucleotide biosynthesis protein A